MANDGIIFLNDTAETTKPDGTTVTMSIERLIQQAVPPRIDSCGLALPREVRFAYTRGPVTILACEYPAGPYTLSWIASDSSTRFGTGTKYRKVNISLPYVIVLAVFEKNQLSSSNECFFRKEPLADIDHENELFFPGLLNCSRYNPSDGRPLAWICTQKLDRTPIQLERDPRRRMRKSLEVLRHCLFESSFNYSSDDHEYSSWYTESRKVDKRIDTVDCWQEETKKDRFMGLDIPWLTTEMNLQQVVDRIFEIKRVTGGDITNVRQLMRLMINNEQKEKKETK